MTEEAAQCFWCNVGYFRNRGLWHFIWWHACNGWMACAYCFGTGVIATPRVCWPSSRFPTSDRGIRRHCHRLIGRTLCPDPPVRRLRPRIVRDEKRFSTPSQIGEHRKCYGLGDEQARIACWYG